MRRMLPLVGLLVALLQVRAQLPTRAPDPPRPLIETVTIYLIGLDDRGAHGRALGCGDSLVAAQRAVPPNSSLLRASVQALLEAPEESGANPVLYNPLHRSRLALEDVFVTRGVATLRLRGQVVAGESCDVTRITGQIIETLRTAGATRGAVMYVNDRSLAEVLTELRP